MPTHLRITCFVLIVVCSVSTICSAQFHQVYVPITVDGPPDLSLEVVTAPSDIRTGEPDPGNPIISSWPDLAEVFITVNNRISPNIPSKYFKGGALITRAGEKIVGAGRDTRATVTLKLGAPLKFIGNTAEALPDGWSFTSNDPQTATLSGAVAKGEKAQARIVIGATPPTAPPCDIEAIIRANVDSDSTDLNYQNNVATWLIGVVSVSDNESCRLLGEGEVCGIWPTRKNGLSTLRIIGQCKTGLVCQRIYGGSTVSTDLYCSR
jgi:hypothetical protein